MATKNSKAEGKSQYIKGIPRAYIVTIIPLSLEHCVVQKNI